MTEIGIHLRLCIPLFFRRSRAADSVVGYAIWPKFKLIQAFNLLKYRDYYHYYYCCSMKKVQSKMKALEWSCHFSHSKYMGIFFRRSRAATSAFRDWIWPKFELIHGFTIVLLTKRKKKIPLKGARVVTTLNIDFSDAQGQITPESVVGSSRNLNSYKLLCISLLPARIMMIQSRLKWLVWSQYFPMIRPLGFFQTLKGS